MQRAPFILVGYRLMSHMHLLVHVCVQVSVRHRALMCVTIGVYRKGAFEKGDIENEVHVNV